MKEQVKNLNLRWVIGYEGLYKISDCGVVISVERIIQSKIGGKNRKVPFRIKSLRYDRDGYLRTELCKNSKTETARVHQLVLKAFGGMPKGLRNEVNHKDGNKENNHISNLEWVTTQENLKHAREMGLCKPPKPKRGFHNPKSKLTKEQYEFILKSDLSYRKLGAMFDVHHSIVYGIKKGTRYNIEN